MPHNPIARPLKPNELTINHTRLIEVRVREFDECIINLAYFSEW
jgi:hypothetical protein